MNFATQNKLVVARKDHECCCFDIYLDSNYRIEDIPVKYRDAIHDMHSKNGKIQIGEEYLMWSGMHEGEFFTARASKKMYELVCDMDWRDLEG